MLQHHLNPGRLLSSVTATLPLSPLWSAMRICCRKALKGAEACYTPGGMSWRLLMALLLKSSTRMYY